MSAGEGLERLVERLERTVAPHGLSVTRREVQRDDDGIAEAEFDVIVQGIIGSSEVRWLIECRDRPSQGPAPASWIEQLIGRRQRFNVDKVIAVSTTGFSAPAQRLAEQHRIPLRTVRHIEDAADELFVQRIRCCLFDIRIVGECRFWKTDGSGTINVPEPDSVRLRLIQSEHGFEPLSPFIWRFLSHAAALNEEWDSTSFTWVAPNDEYLIEIESPESAQINRLECPIVVKFREINDAAPVLSIYEENDRDIGRESIFRLQADDGGILVRLSFGFRPDIEKWVMTVRYPNEIPTSYSRHVMVIRPDGFDTGNVTFPLGEIVFTALKSSSES